MVFTHGTIHNFTRTRSQYLVFNNDGHAYHFHAPRIPTLSGSPSSSSSERPRPPEEKRSNCRRERERKLERGERESARGSPSAATLRSASWLSSHCPAAARDPTADPGGGTRGRRLPINAYPFLACDAQTWRLICIFDFLG